MSRNAPELLIELAANAAEADAAAVAAAARPVCLPMSRLAVLGAYPAVPAEAAHLAACPVCAARLRAFSQRGSAAPPRRLAATWRLRIARAVPFAAAAALVLLFQPRTAIRQADSPPTADARSVPVHVRYAPHLDGPGDSRVDCFQSTAAEACVMLALFRTWNATCQCLMWELHRWEDGATITRVAAGDAVDVSLNVAGSPPIPQLFVVAVARESALLPGAPAEADRLLECLNHSAPPLGAGEDNSSYASAVTACLPSGVTVVPASFVPR